MRKTLYLAGFLMPAVVRAQDAVTVVQNVRASTTDVTTLWKLIESGGWAMLPLAALSVFMVAMVIVFLFTLRRGTIVTAHFMNTADVLLRKRDYHGLLAISSRHGEAVARIAQRTLDFLSRNPGASFDTIREIAQTEGTTRAASLQHRVTYLADIAMLAPMVGLLGTVFGIIRSFGVLASKSTPESSRNLLLASGVSEALVATASGLLVGIAAMAFYAFFRGRVQSLISDLEIASAHFLGLIAANREPRRREGRPEREGERSERTERPERRSYDEDPD
jgi:biopolymer transport protein ExbB